MTRSQAQRFRQRKLSTRQTLKVLREDQVDQVEDDPNAQSNVPKVETGVEKGEEIEHHLQAAISASQAAAIGGNVAQIYIPTPDTIQSLVQYDQLYPLTFSQPATYIRFSSTVEDCSGCPYNLDDEDDIYLKLMNGRQNALMQCSEDQFEDVINFFEETAQRKQPYASVDSPPVVSWDEMESAFDDNFDDENRTFAATIYEHWKAQRLKTGNNNLTPTLKVKQLTIETGADTDDSDPYVCFRRREVRQIRKTRGRDAQSSEKLKKLRRELEDARQLVALLRQREIIKREQLSTDRQLFEQRTSLRQVKRNLPEQYREGDDDILINQKPQKRKPLEITTSQRAPATQLRMPPRPDGRSAEADLINLVDVLAEKENEIEREINLKIAQHQKWNEGYVDMTQAPLTPPSEESIGSTFRTAVTEYLPTPPTSASSEQSGGYVAEISSPSRNKGNPVTVRYASPSYDGPCRSQPSFRRRIGRGGRLMIDRRGMHLQTKEGINDTVIDRFKYDRDDDDDDGVPTYLIDPYDISSMRYRAAIVGSSQLHQQGQVGRRTQLEGSHSSIQASAQIPNASSLSKPQLPEHDR